MSKLRPRVDGTHLWTLSAVGRVQDGTEMGGGDLDPDCLVPMPILWPSLYSLFSHQWPPDLAVSWLLWALTRPGALAQLNFVDGLGEMGHLVILILHAHKYMLRAPQDASILRLQGDLAGKGSQCPTLPCWLSPTPGPVTPVAGTLPVPPGPGPWSPAGSQTVDPQQRGRQLPRLSLLTKQSGPQSPYGAVVAGEERTEVKRVGAGPGGCPLHLMAPFYMWGD